VPDPRRDRPNLPPGLPRVEWKPGLADEMMGDLAPLLAEEGVDVDDIDVPDLPTLQAAMNRAVERHNMTRFTPMARPARLPSRRCAKQSKRSRNRTCPERPARWTGFGRSHRTAPKPPWRPASASASACSTTGSTTTMTLSLLGWLDERSFLPSGGSGKRTAADLLALASKGRAFRSLDKLIARQGGEHVLYGSTLALAAVITTWSTDTGTSLGQLLDDKIRAGRWQRVLRCRAGRSGRTRRSAPGPGRHHQGRGRAARRRSAGPRRPRPTPRAPGRPVPAPRPEPPAAARQAGPHPARRQTRYGPPGRGSDPWWPG
jgi:hypothetical protein